MNLVRLANMHWTWPTNHDGPKCQVGQLISAVHQKEWCKLPHEPVTAPRLEKGRRLAWGGSEGIGKRLPEIDGGAEIDGGKLVARLL